MWKQKLQIYGLQKILLECYVLGANFVAMFFSSVHSETLQMNRVAKHVDVFWQHQSLKPKPLKTISKV